MYELEGVIVKTAALKFNKRSTVELPFSPALVNPNVVPNVLEPKILQVQKTLYVACAVSLVQYQSLLVCPGRDSALVLMLYHLK